METLAEKARKLEEAFAKVGEFFGDFLRRRRNADNLANGILTSAGIKVDSDFAERVRRMARRGVSRETLKKVVEKHKI